LLLLALVKIEIDHATIRQQFSVRLTDDLNYYLVYFNVGSEIMLT